MAVEDARRLLGPDAIIGLSIKTRGAGRGRAARSPRLCRRSAACSRPPRRTIPIRRSARPGLRTSPRRSAAARRSFRSAPSPASTRAMRRCDRGRRRRRRGDLGAVACRRSAAAARELRAVVDAALARAGRAMTADRRHHRGLGFGRRRRHPGRPEDVLGARRLWRLGDHRADRAEHAGRHRHPRRAAGFHRRADRCGVLRSRRRRGEDRHAVAARRHRGGRRRARALEADQRRARSGDDRGVRRPAARAGRRSTCCGAC